MDNKFHDIMEYAIAHVYNRPIRQDTRSMSSITFTLDFSSIFLDAGRRVGKSTYIAQKSRPGDLVIVATDTEARIMRQHTKAQVRTVTQLSQAGFDYRSYEWVWVDEPGRCTVVLGSKDWLYTAQFAKESFLVALGRM